MATEIGQIFVGMNVDLAGFQAGMEKATALASSHTSLMSAEMKRQSREGAESMRLIDEAIGVHVSRPLTRVIAQTQTLGPLLAGAFEFSAAFAVASVIFDKIGPLLERTARQYGLIKESADEVAKGLREGDAQVIQSLQRKLDLQDAYNKLVLGLKGGEYEGKHIELLKQETLELQKQIVAVTAIVAARATEQTLFDRIELGTRNFLSSGAAGPAGLLVSSLWGDASKQIEQQQVEANKLAEGGIAPLTKRLQELRDEIQKDTWQKERDGIDKAAEALKKFNELQFKLYQDRSKISPTAAALPDVIPTDKNLDLVNAFAAGAQPRLPLFSGTSQDQFSEGLNDAAAANDYYRQTITAILSPLEKYWQDLTNLAQIQDRLTPSQLGAALDRLDQERAAGDIQVDKLQEKITKAFKDGTSVSGGVHAFFLTIQHDASQTGKAAFDILNKAVGGFEDNLNSAIVTGKTNWHSLFESLETDLLKFAENQALAGLLKLVAGGATGGIGGFFASLFGGARAAGGDVTPGQAYLVGEEGPEIFSPGSSGSISPNSSLGGVTHNHYYDVRGADAGAVARLERLMPAMAAQAAYRGAALAADQQRRRVPSG